MMPENCFEKGNTVLTDTLTASLKHVSEEIENIRKELRRRGIFVRISRNFSELISHIDDAPDRRELHEQFDPSGDMDGAIDAFWICGFNEDGDLVHTQAAHLLDLRGSSVSRHISSRITNYFPKSPPVRRSSIRANPGPRAKNISGMVAYHGEMWLSKPYRDRATATLVIRLGLLLILREWNPDAVFGFMNWALACKGFNMRVGYMHCEPMALAWEKTSGGEHQVWLVYLEKQDLRFLLDLPAVEFANAIEREFA